MGIMMTKQDDKNQDLTNRITADLRQKMSETTRDMEIGEDIDLAEDSEYVKNFKKSSKFAWVWVVLGVGAIAGLVVAGLMH